MLRTLWMTTRWAVLPIVIGSIFTALLIPGFHWNSELFHVLIESGGALIGFGLAFIVIAMIQKDQLATNYIWLVGCFISMGTLDLLHSQQPPGQAFVWLHSIATFFGGLFAMLIWMPTKLSERFINSRYFWTVLILSTALGIFSIVWPEATLSMLDEKHQFTWSAKILNIVGGISFLIAWFYFAREYHRLHHPQLFYFSNHFCLFALAGLVFEFSALWDGNWWFWHMMRAFAYLFLMFHFATLYRKNLLRGEQELENSLHESENRYKSLIDSSSDWVWEINTEGVFTYASPQVYEMLGYRPDEVVGKRPFELMPEDEAERANTIIHMLSESKSPVNNLENIHLHKNGEPMVLEVNGVPIIDEEGELVGYRGINRDITQRRMDEQEIRTQRDFTNTVLDSAANVIIVLDLEGRFVRFNRAAEELTAYSSDEMLGKVIWEQLIPEEQQDSERSLFKQLSSNGGKVTYQHENEWLTSNGERRLLHWSSSVLRGNDGTISHIVSLGYDVTDQKETEREQVRLVSELQQAHKMESLGHLTGGIAHDFNNLLGIINGYAGLAHEKSTHQEDSVLAKYIDNIKVAGERATSLVAQMLTFSRSDQSEDRSILLQPLIEEELKMLRAMLPASITIEVNIDEDLPSVVMNPTQLNQILMNLMVNARDAMNGVGTLTIRLGWARGLDMESNVSHKQITGDWIELCISDTGAGIDPEVAAHIFNPFFTTKEVGKGTGMGLSVIYGIMENHNGHILLNSELGKGTTFCLLFEPCGDEHVHTEAPEKAPIEIPLGDGSEILIVDDEPMLALHLSELLKNHGYRPHYLTDSTEALMLFKEDPERFSLLITDQTMPKMVGTELISKVKQISPNLPVIICSGSIGKIRTKQAEEQGISFFNKPVDVNNLLLKVANLLNINQL